LGMARGSDIALDEGAPASPAVGADAPWFGL
jgi:hypothetical protein